MVGDVDLNRLTLSYSSACTNGCSGRGGCGGCSGRGGCGTGCSTTCKNACNGLCTGSGSKVSILKSVKSGRFYAGISNSVKQSNYQYIGINEVRKQI